MYRRTVNGETKQTGDVQTESVQREDLPKEDFQVAKEVRHKKKIPVWIIIPAIVILVAFLFLAQKALKKQVASTKTLAVVTVEKGDIKETYNITGTVNSDKIKTFYSPVNAPVTFVGAKVGQIVKEGELIVSFDVSNLERDNQQAELSQRQTELTNQETLDSANRSVQDSVNQYNDLVNQQNAILNQMNQLRAGIDSENKENVENMQANSDAQAYIAAIDKVVAYDHTKIQELNQLIADGEAAYSGKKYNISEYGEYDPLTKMFAYTEITIEQYAELSVWANNLTIQVNNLSAERERQQAIVSENPISSVNSETYAELQKEYEAMEPQIKQAENAVNSVKKAGSAAQIENMRISEELANLAALSAAELVEKGKEGIKAGFSGVIVSIPATEGTAAMQGSEMFTLVDLSSLTVDLEVPASDFEKVFMNQKVKIKIGKNEYQGTVIRVNQIATATTLGGTSIGTGVAASGGTGAFIGATVRIDNPDEKIIVGVSAKLTMVVSEEKDVLTLPAEVVNTNVNGDFVYVIEDGVVKEKVVEVGGASDSKIEILSGLKEGEQVVSDSSGDIEEGMKAVAVQKKD